ncbi:MAG: hypothetical protein QOG83_2832 [Alphaproteobacteria bacterium]|jgi:hypothetical protein|nr:hypothetical protein [Alphaproteobacteria bacterium]
MRVYRLQTDAGERVIGRLITPEALARVFEGLGRGDGPKLSPEEAWEAVLRRGATLELASELQVRRARVMQEYRVELSGFSDSAVDQLKALGLTSEIISWRLRLFMPVDAERGPAILSMLLERHPPLRVIPRAIA